MKRLSILGSTGSIGQQTLCLVRRFPEDLSVVALAANGNTDLIEKQAREFRPLLVSLSDETAAADLRIRLADLPEVKVVSGMEGLLQCAAIPEADMTVVAVVGMIGIRPPIAALNCGYCWASADC